MPEQNEEQEAAVKRLGALVESGGLKIITSEHACQGRRWNAETDERGTADHPSRPDFDQELCSSYAYPLEDPRHNIIYDVVRLADRDHRGRIFAFSAEGACTYSDDAVALLARLTEVNRLFDDEGDGDGEPEDVGGEEA